MTPTHDIGSRSDIARHHSDGSRTRPMNSGSPSLEATR